MNTRPRWSSALLTLAFGCLMLASSCATPTSTTADQQLRRGPDGLQRHSARRSRRDNPNCGACGNACGANRTCSERDVPAARPACSTAAGSASSSDGTHCGPSCTRVPEPTPSCSNNACTAMCPSGEEPVREALRARNRRRNAGPLRWLHRLPTGATCSNNTCACAASGQEASATTSASTRWRATAHCGNCNQACNGTCTNGVCMTTTGAGGAGGRGGATGRGGEAVAGSGTAELARRAPAAARPAAVARDLRAPAEAARRGARAAAACRRATGSTPTAARWNGCAWTGIDSTVAESTTAFTMPARTSPDSRERRARTTHRQGP